MLNFNEYVQLQHYEMINEKLIIYNGGKKYGQIVFLAGGAGSGKGFARDKFISAENFKIRDVDELKKSFQKLSQFDKLKITTLIEKYGKYLSQKELDMIQKEMSDRDISIENLDMKKPEHVYLLHMLVKATRAKEKTLDMMLQGAKEGRLPNILFDITFKDLEEFNRVIPDLLRVGYDPKNIHLTWILTNYEIAMKNNKSRDRIVPDDILLATHSGAAQTVYSLVKDGTPKEIDGSVQVILNNPEHTIFITDPKTGKPYKDKAGRTVVKDFKYLTLKDSGKSAKKEIEVKKELLTWIRDNTCLLYTSPSPRDLSTSRMPSSA